MEWLDGPVLGLVRGMAQAAEAADLLDGDPSAEGLTAAGWVFMLGSLGAVLTLVIFCYRRVLRAHKPIDPGPAAMP